MDAPMPLDFAVKRFFLLDVSGLTSTSTKTLEGVYGHHSPDYQKASARAFRRKA